VQLLKNYLASKHLMFFNISEGRTPVWNYKIKNAGMDWNILEILEIRALTFVLDDFDISQWKQLMKPVRRTSKSN
jgi:hypothetical protein